MDSMRSLNTSLPSARRRPQPPAQLLQAFKTAALQVTNLYKAAATDREQAHEEGYQAALEDMLSFLDNENLGVQDGEGWRVRQWVTEKLQEGMGNHIDSDDENAATSNNNNNNHHHNTTHHDDDKASRNSSSPVRRSTTEEPAPVVSAPPPVTSSLSPEPAAQIATPTTAPAEARPAFDALPKGDFTFRANQSLPAQQADLDMDPEPENEGEGNAAAPMQINVFPRHHGRANHHHNHRGSNASSRTNHARDSSRNNATTAAAVAQINNLGQGAGLKRRAPFGDFFDITGVGNGKDMFGGGGKRGRFT